MQEAGGCRTCLYNDYTMDVERVYTIYGAIYVMMWIIRLCQVINVKYIPRCISYNLDAYFIVYNSVVIFLSVFCLAKHNGFKLKLYPQCY